MSLWVKPTSAPDHERAAIAITRDAYVAGSISLADFEERVERILADPDEAARITRPRGLPQRPDPMQPQTH